MMPRTNLGLRLLYAVAAVVVALNIGTIWRLSADSNRRGKEVVALANQVKSLGGTPVAGTPGARGEPGQNATDAQVADAVRGYLTAHPPAAGRPPTDTEIAAGVAAYCTANNGCQGAAGTNATSSPPATDAQVASAVATFCAARNNCTGPAGIPGTAGINGANGIPGRPPSGFTITLQGNKVVNCVPDTPPDPGTSPHYTCTPA